MEDLSCRGVSPPPGTRRDKGVSESGPVPHADGATVFHPSYYSPLCLVLVWKVCLLPDFPSGRSGCSRGPKSTLIWRLQTSLADTSIIFIVA